MPARASRISRKLILLRRTPYWVAWLDTSIQAVGRGGREQFRPHPVGEYSTIPASISPYKRRSRTRKKRPASRIRKEADIGPLFKPSCLRHPRLPPFRKERGKDG